MRHERQARAWTIILDRNKTGKAIPWTMVGKIRSKSLEGKQLGGRWRRLQRRESPLKGWRYS